MRELRRRSRLALALAVVVLGLFEVQNLVEVLLSQSRLRERAIRGVQEPLRAMKPQVDELLSARGVDTALRAVLQGMPASEVELFTTSGRRLAAQPQAAPVDHWLTPADAAALRRGGIVTVGPVAGGGGRLLFYAGVRSGGQEAVLRVASAASDLVEDLRDRRRLLVGHGVAMVLLVVLGVLAMFPAREPAEGSTPRAIDAYVEAMERLREHGEALEEAMEDREAMARAGELTAGMVHEVRNGLGTIVGYARLVEGGGAPPAAVDAAARIREECETLETVVRRFMDFVRREKLSLVGVDLGRMLSRVVARESRGRPGGEVTLEAGEAGSLVGDEDLLERAFENLVRNAREAAGPKGHVWVRAGRDGDRIAVTISDDGPGIPAADRRKLRPFATTKAGGLGLGLPIALKIVRLHAGTLELSDRSPHGLVVRVGLPPAGPADAGVTRGNATEGTPEPSPTGPSSANS